MKTTRYRFEQMVQEVKVDTTDWLRDEFKAILESEKDFTRKCDYIGFSILSIDAKVLLLDEEIKELQSLKKSLKSAKEIALTTGAEIFAEYGIEKLEGAGVSSITLTKSSTKIKQHLEVLNEDVLIQAGFYIKVLDEDAVVNAYEGHGSDGDRELVREHSALISETIITDAKLRVNKRRTSTKEVLS